MSVISKINPDLNDERTKVTFSTEEFTNWYYGGAENVKEKHFLGKVCGMLVVLLFFNLLLFIEAAFLNDPELITIDMSYLSHQQKYEEAVRRSTLVLTKIRKLQSEGRGGKDLFK